MNDVDRGTLREAEPHPSAVNALSWVLSLPIDQLARWEEAFNSCAIEGNRLAEICAETLYRIKTGQPVSDRYVLGLAWAMRGEDEDDEESEPKSRRQKGKK